MVVDPLGSQDNNVNVIAHLPFSSRLLKALFPELFSRHKSNQEPQVAVEI